MSTYAFIQYGITYAYLDIHTDYETIRVWDKETGIFNDASPLTDELKTWLGLGRLDRYQSMLERIRYFETAPYPNALFEVNGWTYEQVDDHHFGGRHVKWPLDLYYEDHQFKGLVLPHAQCTTFLMAIDHHHPVLSKWQQITPKSPYTLGSSWVETIETRDHEQLSTWIMLPKTTKPVSSILVRTPYGKMQAGMYFEQFIQHGYAVVIQDVRGRSDSSGLYVSKLYDAQDGDDTLNWIAAQPWSNQHVGMVGASYLGYVQWAAASTGNPYLKALVSIVTAGSAFGDLPRKGGTYSSGGLALAFGLAYQHFDPSKLIRDDWDELLKIRPIQAISKVGIGRSIHYIDEELEHEHDDVFWQTMDFTRKKEAITVPAMIVSGWFDDNQAGTREAISLTPYLSDYRIVLGPWMHKGNANRDINGIPMGSQSLMYDLDLGYLLWFKRYLDLQTFEFDHFSKVQCFMLGQNRWLKSHSWPIQTTKVRYYLDHQTLTKMKPKPSSQSFIYDPSNPAPHIIDVSENELSLPNDYQDVAKRPDVLSFQSSPLEEDLSILGTFSVRLVISSTAVDTDFVVRVIDVSPEGSWIQMADGFLTAKYRHSYASPELLVPGVQATLTIETSMIGKTLSKGHCLGLLVTSSADHYIFPHSNTSEGFNTSHFIKATNTIHFEDAYLDVPVIEK